MIVNFHLGTYPQHIKSHQLERVLVEQLLALLVALTWVEQLIACFNVKLD